MELKEAIKGLRSGEKKKFEQTIDLIVNLKGIDVKKDNVSVVVSLPHIFKEKKVCGFLKAKSKIIDSVIEPEFAHYKEKKELKNLVKKYDFFVAHSSLLPKVAAAFGKVLGPSGKMPSPQLGMLVDENDASIKTQLNKIASSTKIRVKEASVKMAVGKENMKDEQIAENVAVAYDAILNSLPNKIENVRNVMIKMTMTKPVKVEIK